MLGICQQKIKVGKKIIGSATVRTTKRKIVLKMKDRYNHHRFDFNRARLLYVSMKIQFFSLNWIAKCHDLLFKQVIDFYTLQNQFFTQQQFKQVT